VHSDAAERQARPNMLQLRGMYERCEGFPSLSLTGSAACAARDSPLVPSLWLEFHEFGGFTHRGQAAARASEGVDYVHMSAETGSQTAARFA